MRSKIRVIIAWIINMMFISIIFFNHFSLNHLVSAEQPNLTDNRDGNWTAEWDLDESANISLENIKLNSGTAKLELQYGEFKENYQTGFQNGTMTMVEILDNVGLGLDLSWNSNCLIADMNNHRVIEVYHNDWLWQYGRNSTSGYTLNRLNKPSYAIRLANERTLITDTENNRIIEVGDNREFYWQYGSNTSSGDGDNQLKKPSSAVPMLNGNVLIADTENDRIIEVNRHKKILWEYDVKLDTPTYAEEMNNGSILIVDKNNHRVFEVNRNKQLYWQFGVTGKSGTIEKLNKPHYATRLENGNTLIADTDNERVIEVDIENKIVWQYGKNKASGFGIDRVDQPTCAIRNSNGNTIISDSNNHRVFEVDTEKNIKWQYGKNATTGSGYGYLDLPMSGLPILKDELRGIFYSQVIDGGDYTNWTNISFEQELPINTELLVYTRTGSSSDPVTSNWSAWSEPYEGIENEIITSPMNRYIQYKVEFISLNPVVSPILRNITINGTKYFNSGELVTDFFSPTNLIKWESFTWNIELNNQNIESYYALDISSPWEDIPSNGDLSTISTSSGKIRFKLIFTTENTTVSPIILSFSLKYQHLGQLNRIHITPNDIELIVGEEYNFIAIGYDEYGRNISITPNWSTTSGFIDNGTFNAQTIPGSGFINATENGIIGSASIRILPGPLDHIEITPNDIIVIAGEQQVFTAFGYDIYNNTIPIEPEWSTNVGIMQDNTLTAQNFAGSGKVTAQVGENTGIASVSITLNTTNHHPPKILSKIPDQIQPEDSEPWQLKLNEYEWDDEDTGDDLKWYITDIDEELYSVAGSYSNEDILTFIPKPNAFGSNNSTLWLIDSDNMTTYQKLWINITPINDKPTLAEIPDLSVHYNEPYNFDYSNYISDIDDSKESLIIEIIEPKGNKYTSIKGFNVTYNYPKNMLGKSEILTLRVSDGKESVEEIFLISISDNHAPKLIKTFSELIMFEDITKENILDLDEYFEDQDGDKLSFSSSSQFVDVTINDNNIVSITSPTSWSGSEIVTFRATDIHNAFAEGYMKVVVLEINDPPQISYIPDIHVHYDYNYYLNLTSYITDPDNETNELVLWTSKIEHITFQDSDPTLLVINFPEEYLGMTINVTLYVSDGIDVVFNNFKIHITDNFPPALRKELPDIQFFEDGGIIDALILNDFFTDLDDQQLVYALELFDNENISIVINDNSSLDMTSKPDWFGDSSLNIRAFDHTGAFIETKIQIIVIPVNDAPWIEALPDQFGKVGERWILDLTQYIGDVDNEISDLEVIVPEEFADLMMVSRQTITFFADKPVDHEIELIITDGYLNSSTTIALKVIKNESKSKYDSFNIWIVFGMIIIFVLITFLILVQKRRGNFKLTDAFIIHRNGLLIKYMGNSLDKNLDEDIFSGMLTGIQELISDSFSTNLQKSDSKQLLKQLKMGDYEVMFQKGDHITLVIIFKGSPGNRLPKILSEFVHTIEEEYGTKLKEWNGSYNTVKGIEKMIVPYLNIKNDSNIPKEN